MPQTVPTAAGFSLSFDYSAFQFDLSLLSDDYAVSTTTTTTASSPNHLQVSCARPIKQEACSPRPGSPTAYAYPSPGYGCELSPRDASPAYPASPYYVPQSPQSAQLYPTSPEPSVTTSKQPVKREKSFDLLTILHESRWESTSRWFWLEFVFPIGSFWIVQWRFFVGITTVLLHKEHLIV